MLNEVTCITNFIFEGEKQSILCVKSLFGTPTPSVSITNTPFSDDNFDIGQTQNFNYFKTEILVILTC